MIHINTYDAEGSLELENAARMGAAMLASGERYDYAADEVARRFYMFRALQQEGGGGSVVFLFWHPALPEVRTVAGGVSFACGSAYAFLPFPADVLPGRCMVAGDCPFPAEPAFGSPEAVAQARERILDHAAGRARRESAPMAVFERIVDGVPEHTTLHASSAHLFPEVDGWARIATVDQRVELLDDHQGQEPEEYRILEIHSGGEREVGRVSVSEVRSRLEELRRTTRAALVVEQAGRRWCWEEVFGARRPASAEPDIEPESLFPGSSFPDLPLTPEGQTAMDELCALWIDRAPRFGAVAAHFPESLRKRRFVASFWAPELVLFGTWYLDMGDDNPPLTRHQLDQHTAMQVDRANRWAVRDLYFWSPELPPGGSPVYSAPLSAWVSAYVTAVSRA